MKKQESAPFDGTSFKRCENTECVDHDSCVESILRIAKACGLKIALASIVLRYHTGCPSGQEMPPMTAEQREWCLKEIGDADGCDRATWEQKIDELLAAGVLQAWAGRCESPPQARQAAETSAKKRTFRITWEDGNTTVTEMNATLDQARAYFIGQKFQFGDTDEHPGDLMLAATAVEEED